MNNIRVLFIILFFSVLACTRGYSQSGVAVGLSDYMTDLSCSVENSVVAQYLVNSEEQYANNIGREGNSLLNDSVYCPYLSHVEIKEKFTPGWTEQPAGVEIPAPGGTSVHVCASPEFKDGTYVEFPVKDGKAIAYNLIPQTVYWFRVAYSTGAVVPKGIFKTQGQLRMIKVDNVLNVRDLGGWPVYDDNGNVSGRLAYGKLFRGATPMGYEFNSQYWPGVITEQGRTDFRNVGIQAELDLRDTEEGMDDWRKLNPTTPKSVFLEIYGQGKLKSGSDYCSTPIPYYLYMIENTSDSLRERLPKALSFIVNNLKNDKSVYYHCSAGADRTGMISMIVEALCGVSEKDIVRDWELTSFATRVSDTYKLGRIISDQEMSYKPNEGKKVSAEMRAVFKKLYDNYGGASGQSFKQQVINWLKSFVYAGKESELEQLILDLNACLVVPVYKSSMLIRDWSLERGEYVYSIVLDEQKPESFIADTYVNSEGKEEESDAYCLTDFIDCSEYTHLITTFRTPVWATFYDEDKNVYSGVSVLSDSDVNGETVKYDYKEYDLTNIFNTKSAKYVRFNVPKYCGWSAVLVDKKP